jgi:hypothetical protein
MKWHVTWALVLVTACTANPNPVPVVGTASDVGALVGEWNGEYRSLETGRSGSISFKLAAGRDTAFGDVIMVPAEAMAPMGATVPPTGVHANPQVLTIRFVRVRGRRISGMIDRYKSPDCGCELLTTFEGDLAGTRISGDFVIRHSGGETPPQKGTWWVKLVRRELVP